MSSGDLKHLLQDLATDGAEKVELDEERLVPRIRSRRRRRASLTAAVAASTAVVLAAGAYAVQPGGDQDQPPVARTTPTPTPTPIPSPGATVTIDPWKTPDWLRCGATFTAPITGDPSLRLATTAREVTRSADGLGASIGLQLTNTTGRTLDFTGTSSGPGIVVVKDGVVVALPFDEPLSGRRWTFAPGQTVTVQAGMSVRRCGRTDPGMLDPGSYQLYALKTFHQNRRDFALVKVAAADGPWTVQLN